MRVMSKVVASLALSLALVVPALALETFNDEAKAQQHCPKDTVVARSRAKKKPAQLGRWGRGMGSEQTRVN
jgi:hypothetical protein